MITSSGFVLLHVVVLVVIGTSIVPSTQANDFVLAEMLKKIEDDTHKFAHAMEDLMLNKCNYTSDETCYKSNYHSCFSELRSPICPGNEYAIQQCGSGKEGGCGGQFDFTTSTVSVAPDSSNPFLLQQPKDDDRIKDGVCTTLRIEEYMKSTTEASRSYWESLGVHPPSLYYGNDDGVFRIFPGSPSICPNGKNDYDPRVRPWYVAASSGPKDIILVLDTSGSMAGYDRLKIMKNAAKAVVNSLGVGDYFAVIEFDNFANVVGRYGNNGLMMRATDENKQSMSRYIDGLEAGGGTVYYHAFSKAFDTFKKSSLQDQTSGCHKALMFLSDGKLNDDEDDLFELIRTELETDTTTIFTYSFGDSNIGSVPGKIACEFDGIWAKISDYGDLSKSMGAYYKFFAYGLGDSINDQFVAWVEPYEYAAGLGMGTTASAPVYDRTVDPPVLAGVVGMDISFAAIQKSIGGSGIEDESKQAFLSTIIQRSKAVCPDLSITDCQLESLRKYGSNDEGDNTTICSKCSSPVRPLKSPLCPYYPAELWHNQVNEGRDFEERTCCRVGEDPRNQQNVSGPGGGSSVCSEESNGPLIGMIAGIAVGTVVVLLGLYLIIRSKRNGKKPYTPANNNSSANAASVQSFPITPFGEDDVVVVLPPSAPVVAKPVSQQI